jgi:hypothetical protein
VRELEGAPRRSVFAWWKPALAFAAMAVVAIFVTSQEPQRGPDITPKGLGTPQAQVWVNRGGKVSVWDKAPLHPDDAIRFEVRPGSYRHLTVVELQAGQLYRVLHSAPVASDGLSPAWAVDDEGSQEEVMVLLSNAPLSDDELRRALAGEGSLWSTRYTFPKEVH